MRLFVAVNLPEAEKTRVHDATAVLREATLPFRWVNTDGLHLTLSFLGEVAETRAGELMMRLAESAGRHAPFPLRLSGLGAFPNLRRPRVLWIGVHDNGSLRRLQADVAAALETIGFAREEREYNPHLTLARAYNDVRAGAFAQLPALAETIGYEGMMNVSTVDLMRSHPGRAGARYERIGQAPLRAGALPDSSRQRGHAVMDDPADRKR
ncbi:MAG: RNA 2',3'-cyclic phosphodiesterase [Longimicrobiales bacterium]